ANGNPLSGRVVTWSSNNTAVATVNGSGLVRGVTAGSATITATSEGQSGTSAVTVTPVPVASVTVTPSPASVTVGLTVQLTATPKDANGNPLSGGLATQYYANTHPSIGNYFELATGQVLTNNDGSSTIENVPNVVRSLVAAGKTWKSYAESIPNACYLGGDTGNYARKHNVFALLS